MKNDEKNNGKQRHKKKKKLRQTASTLHTYFVASMLLRSVRSLQTPLNSRLSLLAPRLLSQSPFSRPFSNGGNNSNSRQSLRDENANYGIYAVNLEKKPRKN